MAEKARYPQIPSTVWWGVRAALNKTPNATFDERYLSVQLGVQEAAARAYVAELVAAGILNEDRKATPLANKWRLDQSYADAASELVEELYPEGLRQVAPPEEADRKKAVSWFQQEGLGTGAAGNKAATYFMIGSSTPNESPTRVNGKTSSSGDAGIKASEKSPKKLRPSKVEPMKPSKDIYREREPGEIPLNVNVQIHISADAGAEQIESIFSAMRRYLHGEQNN